MSVPVALLRHSQPAIDPNRPAHRWGLTAEGRLRSLQIAPLLAGWHPYRVLSSHEPKALETAELIASAIGVPHATIPGVEEQFRRSVPFYSSQQEFDRRVEALFRRPDEVVFGEESADRALKRFEDSLTVALRRHSGERLAVVSHGTVMSLYLARVTGEDAWSLWKRWTTPCLVTVDPSDGSTLRAVSWDGTPI